MGQACWGESNKENEVTTKNKKGEQIKRNTNTLQTRPQKRINGNDNGKFRRYRVRNISEQSNEEIEVTDRGLSFFEDDDDNSGDGYSANSDIDYFTQHKVEIDNDQLEFSHYEPTNYPKEKAIYQGELKHGLREGRGMQRWKGKSQFLYFILFYFIILT